MRVAVRGVVTVALSCLDVASAVLTSAFDDGTSLCDVFGVVRNLEWLASTRFPAGVEKCSVVVSQSRKDARLTVPSVSRDGAFRRL